MGRGRKTKPVQQELAFQRYLNGENKGDIAEAMGVAPTTISEWAKNNDWEKRKRMAATNPDEVLYLVLEQMQKVLAGEKPTANLKDLRVLSQMVKELRNEITPNIILACLTRFNNYVAANTSDTELLVKLRDLQNKYLKTL